MIKKYQRLIIYAGCFSLIILFCVFSTDLYERVTPDTNNYVDISRYWFDSKDIGIRPLGYPAFIWFCKKAFGENWLHSILLFQIFFFALAGIVFLRILEKTLPNIKLVFLMFLTFLCFLNPQTIASTLYILPESLPLFFMITSVFLFTSDQRKHQKNLLLILSSFLAFLSYLLKPIWLILPVCIVLGELSNIFKKIRIRWLNSSVFIISYLIFFLTYTLFIKTKRTNILSSIKDKQINLQLVRMGAFIDTDETKLFRYYEQLGLIDSLKKRSWTNEPQEVVGFNQLKHITPEYLLYSSEFWKTAFQNQQNRKKFFFNTINRIPKFFSTSAENGAVKIMGIGYLNYIYQAGYSFIHKKLWFLVFFGFIVAIHPFFILKERTQDVSLASCLSFCYIVIFSSIGLTIFTYQDSNFLRYRSAVEPIILFFIFVSIFQFIKTVYISMKALYKRNLVILTKSNINSLYH